ncbi:MAG: adenylate kinase [Candidatus Woesearchaeota archaeon]|nr:adenylate kinase [Candidatus Woesearchaeota archaeon]
MKIILLGSPGCGKGTQAKLLSNEYKLPHISTGDIFREEIAKGTELGKKADALIKRGRLVPNSVTNRIVKKRIAQDDCRNGFILDGYPRNSEQARFISSISKIDIALFIEVSDDSTRKRLLNRYYCAKCGAGYNTFTGPKPKKEMICDKCSLPLLKRKDDDENSIERRLEIYHRLTEPVISIFRKAGNLISINGEQVISEVHAEIMKKIKNREFEQQEQ